MKKKKIRKIVMFCALFIIALLFVRMRGKGEKAVVVAPKKVATIEIQVPVSRLALERGFFILDADFFWKDKQILEKDRGKYFTLKAGGAAAFRGAKVLQDIPKGSIIMRKDVSKTEEKPSFSAALLPGTRAIVLSGGDFVDASIFPMLASGDRVDVVWRARNAKAQYVILKNVFVLRSSPTSVLLRLQTGNAQHFQVAKGIGFVHLVIRPKRQEGGVSQDVPEQYDPPHVVKSNITGKDAPAVPTSVVNIRNTEVKETKGVFHSSHE